MKSQVVVLSDIHLGDNSPTCTYQRSIHEKPLLAIFDWIVSHADDVAELVLLGDIMDTWSYPFDVQPPNFQSIMEHNPRVFGATGGLARVLDALEGGVTFVRGNHDMTLSAGDVARVTSPNGHQAKFAGDGYLLSGAERVLLRHGNEFTMFNAADPMTKWAPLPVGHFVTRMIAEHWHQHLEPGQNVSMLKDQGYPNGLDWSSVVEHVVESLDVSIADVLIDGIAGREGVEETSSIILADGTRTTLLEVKEQYRNLFSHWVERNGGGEEGLLVAIKAALADLNASHMGWFAQRQAFVENAQLVVMGHTHVPIAGLSGSLVNYVNSGFECPSVADMPKRTISFAVIDTGSLETKLFRVVEQSDESIVMLPCPSAHASIVPAPGRDLSCYVVVDNSANEHDLALVDHTVHHGFFVTLPRTILAGSSATIWLQDLPHLVSTHGSNGSVTYRSEGGGDVNLSFACPREIHPIRCSGNAPFRAKTGEGDWLAPGQVPTSGHPLIVQFTVTLT
jgi:UDP-2,3-diacylglucosamine pyrophosphatase LpxH